jgi:hydroxypyruvate isomerase
MPRFAANLSLLYSELPFLERFEASALDGFRAVECLFPYAWPAPEVAARLAACGLEQVLINAPVAGWQAGEAQAAWEAGERGLACLPGREAEFQAGLRLALDYARQLGCPRIHVMAGCVPPGTALAELQATYVSNLRWAAALAADAGITLLIEPLNPRNMPGYFLQRQQQAHEVLAQVGSVHLKVQMDLYHCQIVEGDLATKLRSYIPTGRVGHVQVAGVPERHEPDVGELNYPYLFALLDQLGYDGWVGCEYWPARGPLAGATRAGLGWLRRQ